MQIPIPRRGRNKENPKPTKAETPEKKKKTTKNLYFGFFFSSLIFIPLFRGACGAPRLLPGWERRGRIPPLPSVRNQRNKTTPSHWIPARTRGFLGSGFVFPFPFLPPPHSLSTFPSLPFPFFFSKDTRSCSILFSQLEFSGLGSERRFKNKTKTKRKNQQNPKNE